MAAGGAASGGRTGAGGSVGVDGGLAVSAITAFFQQYFCCEDPARASLPSRVSASRWRLATGGT
jgi:hypothetical protein